LNLTSLEDACVLIKSAGYSSGDADELFEHWYNWSKAISDGAIRLHPFAVPAASAAPTLRQFFDRRIKRRDMSAHGFGEFGTDVFRRALASLEGQPNRRDEVLAFFCGLQVGNDDEALELARVRGMFFRQMFEVVAVANGAHVEHSASIGLNDEWALSADYLERLEAFEPTSNQLLLDSQMVAALGQLDCTVYKDEIKGNSAGAVAAGFSSARRSVDRRTGEMDLSALTRAFETLATNVGRTRDSRREGALGAIRRVLWSAVGAATGASIAIAMKSTGLDVPAITAAGAMTARLAEEAFNKGAETASTLLLRRSFVREGLSRVRASANRD
jgi:hypothetical protein